jgi:hypothetical protein
MQAFNKARRMETRERLSDHMVTYKDWQKLLGGVKVTANVVTVVTVTSVITVLITVSDVYALQIYASIEASCVYCTQQCKIHLMYQHHSRYATS